MARIASKAVAGYYPTPEHLISRIAKLIAVKPSAEPIRFAMVDPCAGDGAALFALAGALFDGEALAAGWAILYGCELEASRYEALNGQRWATRIPMPHMDVVKGDAFGLRWSRVSEYGHAGDGATLLYLNPPYDLDPVHGRLEERFLTRFASTLAEGGVLVFVVPYYALAASARTLATQFADLRCFRFPEPDFEVFKQVVLVARRRELLSPDPAVVAQVEAWARDAGSIPELVDGPVVTMRPTTEPAGFGEWKIAPVDLTAILSKARPWHSTERGGRLAPVPGILPAAANDLLARSYPVAMPPRAAHIAAGIAAGVFNGARIEPDDASSGLPALLVKGVFDREFVAVDEKRNKDGEKIGEVQVQQPRLVVTALDLRARRYHTIKSATETTGARSVAEMTTADLLASYGRGMMAVMLKQCPVLHNPARSGDQLELPELPRRLYTAQAQAVMATVKLLGGIGASKRARRGKAAFVLGEIGSGKCLGLGTKVMRFDGSLANVEDIRVGDTLMGPDSTPRRVLGTTRGDGPLYQVTPVTGEPWICNDAHLLTLVHTMSGDVIDIPASEYASKKRLRMRLTKGRRPTHAVGEFKQFFPEDGITFPPSAPLPIDPYFLGVWYGDGTKDLESVTITKPDSEIRDVALATAAAWGLRVREHANAGGCPGYSIATERGQGNPLLRALRAVVGNGAELPHAYLTASVSDRRSFLAGLLDTDGYHGGGYFEIVQKRRGWAEGIAFLARSLGLRATMSEKIVNGASYWRVNLSGNMATLPLRILRKQAWPRATVRVTRKGATTSRPMRRVSRTGIRLKPIGEGEYAGFELDGDGRFLLGDFTVTHNSSVALATAVAIDAKRVLVMCPPHLLDSWRDQAKAVVPWARVVVLSDVQDVDTLAADTSEGLVIAILSRETAKLGHALEGVTGSCPACGAGLPKRDLAKTRARCETTRRLPASPRARYAKRLGLALLPIAAAEATVAQLFEGRHERRLIEAFAERPAPGGWEALRTGPVLRRLVRQITSSAKVEDADWTIAMLLLVAIGDDAFTAHTARTIYRASLADPSEYRFGSMARTQARAAALLMTAGCTAQETLGAELAAYPLERSYGATYEPWKAWREACASLAKGEAPAAYDLRDFKADGTWRGHERGSVKATVEALGMLALLGAWTASAPCGEPLYQAIPEPRRYPLASYIAKRAPKLFDLLVLDEGHEFAGDGSAQGFAAHRLVGLGTPTLLLTGSVMGGYAESLFANQWSLDPDFRTEFARDQRQEFVRRYGYLKQIVETKNAAGKVVAFGAVTDRVERTARTIGNAPGVLPVFVLRYLLRLAVTLHKSDLALDLPARHEIVERVEPSEHQRATLAHLQAKLVARIRRDSFGPLSGKLWGQMAELPSYLDRATADTGNVDGGAYVIAYPEGVEGGGVVAEAAPLPASELLPKEAWMLKRVKTELAEGRRVMILAWHSAVLPRLARLIEGQLGEKCPVLDAGKVQASKRQAWIDREVIAKGRRVLVVNPVAVQTGLNNLVWFATQVWMENPAVNAIVYRQATGRIDRIGQTLESRIYFPVYAGTTQDALHKLLLHKVGVSMSTDGLDGESALQAAGVGVADGASALAVGRQLYDLVLAGLGSRAKGEAA